MGKTTVTATKKLGFFQRTSMYGFELFMALFGLVTSLIVIDYSLFALAEYLFVPQSNSYAGELMIWVVAAMIVWLPVTIVFYLRSRAELERNDVLAGVLSHKMLLSLYYFSVIFGAIILGFIAMYSLIRVAVTPDASVSQVLLRVVLPSVVAIAIHVGMMFAMRRSKRPSRRVFALAFGASAAVLAGVLLVISIIVVRGSRQDEIILNDFNSLDNAISIYKNDHGTTPNALADLQGFDTQAQGRFKTYAYSKVDDTRYQLCANFATNTIVHDGWNQTPGVVPMEEYRDVVSIYAHESGHQCFKLVASYQYPMYDQSTN